MTNDLNRYNDVNLSGNGTALVTVQSNRTSNIWVAPDGDSGRAKQITVGTSDSSLGLSWTPDGKIVFQSDPSGKSEIWIMNADGRERKQITHDGYNYRSESFLHGTTLCSTLRAGKTNVWRMDLDSGNPRQLTNGRLRKVSIDGGQPVQVHDLDAHLPVISPDGKQVAALYQDEKANPTQGVMIFPFTGGETTKRLNIVPDVVNGFALHWSPDGRTILHFNENLSNIWSQPSGWQRGNGKTSHRL